MLHLILHHAALELVPDTPAVVNHPAIRNDAQRRRKPPNQLLLDLAVHKQAIPPSDQANRGRPDITHFCLLEWHFAAQPALELGHLSANHVSLTVHTRNDLSFVVPADWRVPVSYIRFRGLVEKLLVEGHLPAPTTVPLEVRQSSLDELVTRLSPTRVFELTQHGPLSSPEFLTHLPQVCNSPDERWVLLVGGYQRGSITLPPFDGVSVEPIALSSAPLPAWKVVGLLVNPLLTQR